jgi:hypothetical protein
MATWQVDVKCFYVNVFDKKKKKEVSVPVFQRKMYVECKPVIDSGIHRIFCMKRNGTMYYSLATIPRIAQPFWSNPEGKSETWYKLPPDQVDEDGTVTRPYKAVRRMTEVEFLNWLTVILGKSQAKIALHTLMTAETEKKVAA